MRLMTKSCSVECHYATFVARAVAAAYHKLHNFRGSSCVAQKCGVIAYMTGGVANYGVKSTISSLEEST